MWVESIVEYKKTADRSDKVLNSSIVICEISKICEKNIQ